MWQGPGDLANSENTGIPPFMTDEAAAEPAAGILVIRGDTSSGLTYSVRRGAGNTLGEDEIGYASEPDPAFQADVRALVSRPTAQVVDDLAAAGIRYLVLPEPYDGSVAAGLDATDGLGQAGTESQATRTWRIETRRSTRTPSTARARSSASCCSSCKAHRPGRGPRAEHAHPACATAYRGGRRHEPRKARPRRGRRPPSSYAAVRRR